MTIYFSNDILSFVNSLVIILPGIKPVKMTSQYLNNAIVFGWILLLFCSCFFLCRLFHFVMINYTLAVSQSSFS